MAQKKYQALRSCSVFINVLKEVVECDDIPEIPTELGFVITSLFFSFSDYC